MRKSIALLALLFLASASLGDRPPHERGEIMGNVHGRLANGYIHGTDRVLIPTER